MTERVRGIARKLPDSPRETERDSEITDIHCLVRPVIHCHDEKSAPPYSGADGLDEHELTESENVSLLRGDIDRVP